MTRMRLTIIPKHNAILPYPPEYIHQVDLDDDDYTAEDLGEAMMKALEKAHSHPGGPEWFNHFTVHFEVGDPPAVPEELQS